MSGSQMAQLEPVSSKLDAPISMGLIGFGTNDSLQHHIPTNMSIGQMVSMSNDLGLQFSLAQTQQGGNTESQTYTQLPQQQQGGNFGSQTYTQLPHQRQGGNIGSQTYTHLPEQQQAHQQQGGNNGTQTYAQLPQQQQGGNIDSQTFTLLPQQQGGKIGSQTYTQLPQQILMSNKPIGLITPTMLDSPRQHQLRTLNKRKAPMDPISPNSIPEKLSLPNKRVEEMEHRPWLQPMSAPSKRPAQVQTGSYSPGSQPSPASNKKAVPNKPGSSASRYQPAQMRPSPRVQMEAFESVRSKMRENLAGALALVSQKQVENATVEKKSNDEAAASPGKREEVSLPAELGSDNSGAVLSIPAEPQRTLSSNQGGSPNGNNNDATQTVQYNGQQLQSSNLLPDEDVPFSDNIFARDELLQGNDLSWVLEPGIDVAKKKEFEIDGKQIPDDEKIGKDNLEKSSPSPEELPYQIEAELFKLFGGRKSCVWRNSPNRLCSMSAEELASKELSQWRQAKAEELAQMVVLPDVQVDIRRLVRKTHKGEVQVEIEQTDSSAVEVSAGTSVTQRPKTDAKRASMNDKTVRKKDESDAAGKKINPEDPNLTITIPSSEGPDPMQGLMGEDELKDADFLPPIVSLDEFMQSLDSEPPFENLPGDAGKSICTSDKDDSAAGSDSKSSGRASQDLPDTMSNKPDGIDSSKLKSDSDVKLNVTPTKTETIVSAATLKGERVWEGMIQLNGRVRLDAFEKFLQELPMSRSRAVMVVHVVCKEGSTESEHGSLLEAADSYILDERVGFAEASSGVEIYFCPPYAKTLERLTKILPKDQLQALNAIDNGLIGVVVWRRAPLISPNSTSHHKFTTKKQHFTPTSTSRRPHEKDCAVTNMNTNFPSKPTSVYHSVTPPDDDDDDDVPPGFGPAASRDEDDLPEFNFSGGSNPSGPKYPTGSQSQRVGMTSSHLHSQTSSSPVDQMRELIQKYGGQSNSNSAPVGFPMQRWNDVDDDDDIPEWQPQTSQQQHMLPPPNKVRKFQQPMHAPHQLHHQTLPAMHVQGQHGNWWVPQPGSPSPGQPLLTDHSFMEQL
ncbi:SPOC domain / Transcription elongation factor S-II protein, putative isoform 2 [Hibiscus syriacus]|uniref:SPOC domain / Transcription elongation factor S-II protein, putative isoform 2 n=1 Tax=Hibiscus syriacus TaxID=106335 RepID=A0A6A2Y4S0_HIBSY|nr:SPOC domain / Transcription elongation factor S-II protein, putative isoform 2 [Hibiscus syriacus]